jgi:hypothetical protein
MHERTGMHEPACILAAATASGCWLLLAADVASCSSRSSNSSSQHHQPASASKHDELRVFLSPPIARPLKSFFFKFYLHAAASKPACILHGMLVLQNRHACCMACCCFKTGMRDAWHAVASAAAAAAAACMRACVAAFVIDTIYQLTRWRRPRREESNFRIEIFEKNQP